MAVAELTFAGDEAGDASFSFSKGASRYFVFALVATDSPEILRSQLNDVRLERGLPKSFEFAFHGLTSDALRKAVFQALALTDFSAWGIAVDKQKLPAVFRALSAHVFYAHFACELIKVVPTDLRRGAVLWLDEFDPSGKALLALKRELRRRDISRGFRKMTNVRSRGEPLVQVADLMAGALLRQRLRGYSEALETVRSKFQRLYEYRPDQ